MHILLVAGAFNSLTQRVHAELRDRGHTVAVELALPGRSLPEAVRRHEPQLVLAPMLKTVVPREVWSAYTCLIVHPGPVGDRGPSSLDWAIHEGADRWGVTVLQAEEELDAGAVWASVSCPLPAVGKSDLYRNEIADAALAAVLLAVERFVSGTHVPLRQRSPDGTDPAVAAPASDVGAVPASELGAALASEAAAALVPASEAGAVPASELGAALASEAAAALASELGAVPASEAAAVPASEAGAVPASELGAVSESAAEAAPAPAPASATAAEALPGLADAMVVPPRTRPYLDQSVRRIDWCADGTATVLRKLRAADSRPGVLDVLLGGEWYLHGGHPEEGLRGRPGELLATRAGALCRATKDGAVWIPELRPRRRSGGPRTFRLPATQALGDRLPALPELPAPPLSSPRAHNGTWTDIRYREDGETGFLSFSFPGGAMSTGQCRRLLAAYREVCERPTTVLVLGGPRDFFSNGIHLNVIEAAADPAAESWANINAIDDLVEAVLTTTDRLVVAAVAGNAAAGGVMLALAADEVWCRSGAVLNPHYRLMGLYGSEYWTYTLPRRVGSAAAERIMSEALPMSAVGARRVGLVDQVLECAPQDFPARVGALASRLASLRGTGARIAAKKAEAERRQSVAPLAGFRERELARMRRTFEDPDAPYHALRRAFVRKDGPLRS
ncbi:hydrogenase maturation protein [Streptomyces sp. NPDC002265]|uniref:hydrogenase maturation protein n=1 Tax=Streptomyces sp. NPDC002265 TaxID=3154415 RepID=UPI00332C173E